MSKSLALRELPFTGERLVTQDAGSHVQMIFEHLHRYFVASECCRGKQVLDIACGEGYGSDLLAQVAQSVVGVDIAADVVRHAAKKYRRDNLRFLVGDCVKIPLPRHSVDVVVSFETIEHLREHGAFLEEIRRVLRPRGVLIISSPDKSEYTERLGQHNPFHVAELYRNEFLDLLKSSFRNCRSLQQRLVGGSFIAADGHVPGDKTVYGTHRGDFQSVTFTEGVHAGLYVVAVCSDGPLPSLRLGLLENIHESSRLWHAYETSDSVREEIDTLRSQLSDSEKNLAEGLRQREQLETDLRVGRGELEALQRHAKWLENETTRLRQLPAPPPVAAPGRSEEEFLALKAKDEAQAKQIAGLEEMVVKRGEWGQRLNTELAAARERIVHLEKLVEERSAQIRTRENEFTELSASAQTLRTELAAAGRRITEAELALDTLRHERAERDKAQQAAEQKLAEAQAATTAAAEREAVLAATRAEAERLLEERSARLQARENELAAANAATDTVRTELAQAARRITETEAALDVLRREGAERERAAQAAVEQKLAEAQAVATAAAAREAVLAIAHDEARQRAETAERLLAESDAVKAGLLQSRSALEREVLTRGKRALELEAGLKAAGEEAARLESMVRELTARSETRGQEEARLRTEADELRGSVGGLQAELAALRQQLATAETSTAGIRELEAKGQEIAGLSLKLDKEKSLAARLRERCQHAEGDLTVLEDQLVKAQESIVKFAQEAERTTIWAAELDQTIQRERKDFARLNEEFNERTRWALAMSKELETLRPRWAYLEDKVARMQESLSWRSTAVFRAIRRLVLGK